MKRKNKQAMNFSIIGLLALAIGGGTSYMAFGGTNGNKTNIAFVSNNGKVWDDGSFMTGAHNGITEYTDNVGHARLKTDTSGEYDESGVAYIEPTQKALNAGNDMVVSAGFNYAPAITGQQQFDPNGDPILENGKPVYDWEQGIFGAPISGTNQSTNWGDRTVVLADDNPSTGLASIYSNAISINYKSEGGGLIAGAAAAMYSTAVQIVSPVTEDNLTNVVVPYGGFAIDAVYDFMSGFEQGVNWYNYAILGYTPYNHDESPITKSGKLGEVGVVNALNNGYNNKTEIEPIEVVAISTSSEGEGENEQIKGHLVYAKDYYNKDTPADINNWYIQGFPDGELTSSGKKATFIADESIDQKIPIIFPVAGAATMYTYQELENEKAHDIEGNYTQIISVDSDAVKVEADDNGNTKYDEYILGSSVKNLEMSIQYAVWFADSRQEENYVAKDMNGSEEKIDPSGNIANSTEFMKPVSEGGWNYSTDVNTDNYPDNDIAGQQFTGNLENGGSYFTPGISTNGNYELHGWADEVIIGEFDINKNLSDMEQIVKDQNPLIESSSQTFSPDPAIVNKGVLSKEDIVLMDNMPWLINYNIEKIV